MAVTLSTITCPRCGHRLWVFKEYTHDGLVTHIHTEGFRCQACSFQKVYVASIQGHPLRRVEKPDAASLRMRADTPVLLDSSFRVTASLYQDGLLTASPSDQKKIAKERAKRARRGHIFILPVKRPRKSSTE